MTSPCRKSTPSPFQEHLLRVCSGSRLSLSKMCLSAHTCIHALHRHKREHTASPGFPYPLAHIQPQASPAGPSATPEGCSLRLLCSFLLQPRKLMLAGSQRAPPSTTPRCCSSACRNCCSRAMPAMWCCGCRPWAPTRSESSMPTACCWDCRVSSSGSC